ncbi:hypothetical protein EDC04DRAFT_3137208 [Pisolithus marmoratus]|nr:hypothetical protein EDC04DRAFT_3137208 [Pisolithus marmoratus]
MANLTNVCIRLERRQLQLPRAHPPQTSTSVISATSLFKRQAFVTSDQLEGHRSDAHSPNRPGPSTVNGGENPSPPPQADLPSTRETCNGPSCSQCNQQFKSWADLDHHIRWLHKYPCSKCAERFPSLQEWNRHYNAIHRRQSNAAPAACDGPPAAPVIRPTSSQSNRSGVPPPEQQNRVVCDQCNSSREFKNNEALKAHVAAKHPSGPNCPVCQHRATSATALEAHVNEVHCCNVCRDGIVRDAKTLEDHMVEHTHPFRCETCETMYRSEEERSAHFTSSDRHPLCAKCQTGFVDDAALQTHVSSIHPPSRIPSPRKELVCPRCPELFAAHVALEAHLAEAHPIFECHICRESYSTQSTLTDHISVAHSCPVCSEGVYVDPKSLEEHLEEHHAPYRCALCGTRYTEEGLLFQHYKESPDDVHPVCMRCDLGFENDNAYNIHVAEVHRPTPCEACEGLLIDEDDLPLHYLTSRKHPTCGTCQIGFKDTFSYSEHGALQHPESHCYLCQWQLDSGDALQSHIRHFANHPKCVSCDLRFADVETYQRHLFTIHCPKADDDTASSATQINRNVENQPGCSSEAHGPLYASSIPPLPSASGYSSPTSQNVDIEYLLEPDAQSCSSTLTIDHPSPRESELRQFAPPSLSVDTDKYTDCQEFNHSPLSMVPAVGTPLLSSAQTAPSVDYRSPFNPSSDRPPVFRPTPVTNGLTKGSVHLRGEDSSDSSFARSPPLISPGVKLPSPVAGSPTSSGWTSDSGSVTKLSLNSPVSSNPKNFSETDKSMSVLQVSSAGNSIACMPASTSPISPESAGISVSAVTQTPEYLRDARAYLPLIQPTSRGSSPSVPHSPTNSSPILSSTGLAMGDNGRRREVRFDDNIMSEPVWDRESTSSDPSLDVPVPYRRINGIHARKYGASKLPRFSSLRRRRTTNGKANYVSAPANGRTFQSAAPSYHCRVCLKDSCDDPTTTTCGHLFCYGCISNSVMDDPHCPVCNAPTLLYCLFRMDLSA